jgi:hypothetical protein
MELCEGTCGRLDAMVVRAVLLAEWYLRSTKWKSLFCELDDSGRQRCLAYTNVEDSNGPSRFTISREAARGLGQDCGVWVQVSSTF